MKTRLGAKNSEQLDRCNKLAYKGAIAWKRRLFERKKRIIVSGRGGR